MITDLNSILPKCIREYLGKILENAAKWGVFINHGTFIGIYALRGDGFICPAIRFSQFDLHNLNDEFSFNYFAKAMNKDTTKCVMLFDSDYQLNGISRTIINMLDLPEFEPHPLYKLKMKTFFSEAESYLRDLRETNFLVKEN